MYVLWRVAGDDVSFDSKQTSFSVIEAGNAVAHGQRSRRIAWRGPRIKIRACESRLRAPGRLFCPPICRESAFFHLPNLARNILCLSLDLCGRKRLDANRLGACNDFLKQRTRFSLGCGTAGGCTLQRRAYVARPLKKGTLEPLCRDLKCILNGMRLFLETEVLSQSRAKL